MAMEEEPKQQRLFRRWIMLSFLGAAVLIGLPMWVLTTSIYRAPLNYSLMDHYDKHISPEVVVPVYINAGKEFPDLAKATQVRVEEELAMYNVSGWKLDIIKGRGSKEDYNVELEEADDEEYVISETAKFVKIGYTLELVSVGRVPDLVSAVLLDSVFGPEVKALKASAASNKVVSYSPKYHLTFSLFYAGGSPVSWDIGQALEEHFTPLRQALSNKVANFTIDTQVQYYSTLAFDLPPRDSKGDIVLDHEQLSTFINFADWSLTSIHSYPTLHFVLYVPEKKQTPMVVKDSATNSFSIPQWGGVVITNQNSDHFTSGDLLPALETFSSQLLGLLGAPNSPRNPVMRIDALSRISAVRALNSSASTLGSLYRLSQSLPNIAIPKPVLYAVEDTLDALKESLAALKSAQWKQAVVRAGDALTRSQSAFFDKMMVQQMYFPEEHKVAIYLPLLGPICVVMGMGVLRVASEFNQDRKNAV